MKLPSWSWSDIWTVIGAICFLAFIGGFIAMMIFSELDERDKTKRCQDLGGHMIEGQCIEGKVIPIP